MTDSICLRTRPGEIEVVVTIGGALADYALWRPAAPDGFGDLHRGRVSERAPSLGGTFVKLEGEPDGFLSDRDAGSAHAVGDLIGARIIRSSRGEKGPKLSSRLGKGDAAATGGELRRVRRGPTPLDEVLETYPDLPVSTHDRALAATLGLRVIERLIVSDIGCSPDIEDQIASLREAEIALPGGARASIWPTPALVAIDVDSAGAGRTRSPKQAAQFAVNRLVLPRLLHEVRLRNLSGAILIDLAGLASRKRVLLQPDFEAALASDPLRPRLLGFTALGLAEIVRVRRRPALHELCHGPYAGALAAAASLAAAQAGVPHRALALRVSPDLGRLLDSDPAIGRDLVQASGRPLILKPDPSLKAGTWNVEEIGA